MARRVGPWHQVKLWARGYSHYVPHPGGAYNDLVKDLYAQKRGLTPYFAPVTYGLGPAAAPTTPCVACITLGPWATAMATPCLDLVQAATLGLSSYTLGAGTWYEGTANLGQKWCYQTESTPSTRTLTTTWTYPPEPVFCVTFWRGEVNNNWTGPATDNAFYTTIEFGGGAVTSGAAQFRVMIPYAQSGPNVQGYNDSLARYEDLPLVEGASELGPISGTGGGERVYLWVFCARDAIWISTDGFKSQAAGYSIPDAYLDASGAEVATIAGKRVLSGLVRLTHVGGQFGANVWPIWMPRSTASPALAPTFQSDAHEFSYAVADNPNPVEYMAWVDDVLSDPGGGGASTTLAAASISIVATGAYSRAWKATLEPYAWTNAGVTTYTSPLLHAVQIWQKPNVVAYTGAALTSTVATDVRAIELTYPGVGKPTVGRVDFLNHAGTYSSLLDYQRVAVKLGTKVSGTTSAATSGIVFTGYIRTPGGRWANRGQAQQAEAFVFDAMTRLDDLKAVGDEPDAGAMSPSQAVAWFLARGMVPSGSISGTLSTGLIGANYVPEEGALSPRLGQPYREILNRIMERGPAGSSAAGKGGSLYLKYTSGPVWERWVARSGPFTATGVSWALTEKATPDHGSSVFHIYDLIVDKRAPADDHEWANLVTVRGRTAQGAPVVAYAIDVDGSSYDPSGQDFAGGWHHNLPIQDDTLQTQQECFAKALQVLSEVNTFPQFVTVETDFLSGAQYGQVFSVTGPATGKVARANVARAKFRIEEFRHRAVLRELPKTTVTGRYIGSMAP